MPYICKVIRDVTDYFLVYLLSFVVHNFFFLTPILPRTRKAIALNLALQAPLVNNLLHFILTLPARRVSLLLKHNLNYSSYIYLSSFLNGIWGLPTKSFFKDAGLYTNNLTKSFTYWGLRSYTAPTPPNYTNFLFKAGYYKPRIALHFALLKSSLKTVILFFLQYLLYSYPNSQSELNLHTNYVILSRWAYLYPPLNSFYFRTYNY